MGQHKCTERSNCMRKRNCQIWSCTAVRFLDPETTIPKFPDELKAAGADTIIAEKQRQLDDWLEANK